MFFFVFSEGSKSTNGLWMNVFVKALPILIPNSDGGYRPTQYLHS